MNPLRVGLGTTILEPGAQGARLDGIGVYTDALLRHLPQAGCAVSAYSYPPCARTGPRAGVGQPMAQSFEAASLVDLVTPRMNRVHMPADIFHATDYRIVRMDCPVVATLHDALPQRHPQWCNPRLRGPKNWLQKKAAAKADHVIAISRFAVAELVQCFGVDERRISVVPCGVDAAWLEPNDPEAVAATLRANGLRPGYFLFVGTLQPRKNIERLLAAYLGLPAKVRAERQLVIVGALGWRCEALVRQILAARQNGANVLWLRSLTDNARLRHVYAGAGVFVFASLYEGFGIPVLEAFASAVPVVVSNSSALPEVAQGAALEVDPGSICEIGAAMLALVRDEPLRARCIAAGRRRAAQLSWREAARATAAVYRAVLSH
ncbi:glycosyltransferase family 4 protein [Massilia glaciei]|uniref:Glycosyltransferase family 1 protein n=1 Tax=Massilia glaciei TaxID=1524097 RepID=A0A2U2HF92_9BURK|nr:glycosyltransferase family 1 protein [Massilia glaciei]PWF42869.1 glycosyltransferase family 1 protein [Massilia glaciei]